jgi:hypothetical protein
MANNMRLLGTFMIEQGTSKTMGLHGSELVSASYYLENWAENIERENGVHGDAKH